MPRSTDLSTNLGAFLDMIAYSELGHDLLHDPATDDGYKVVVGSRPGHLILMNDYAQHPRLMEQLSPTLRSDAAGRYQILGRYAGDYARMLSLPDFGPVSQDKIAIQLIRECHALNLIECGHLGPAVTACKSRWASLPGAGYGQRENDLNNLQMAFLSAGGKVA